MNDPTLAGVVIPPSVPTLAAVRLHREEILRVAAAHGASNVRIFGSVARGDAIDTSDVDMLFDIVRPGGGFAYYGLVEDLRRALEEVLGRHVDVVDAASLNRMRERVLGEAVPL